MSMKLVGYYYCMDGINRLDFGEAALKCFRIVEKKIIKNAFISTNNQDIRLEIDNVEALGLTSVHI